MSRYYTCPMHCSVLTVKSKSIYFRSGPKEFHTDKELFTRKCSFLISIFKASVDIRVVNNETSIRQGKLGLAEMKRLGESY